MTRSFIFGLLLPLGMWFNLTCVGADPASSHPREVSRVLSAVPKAITIRRGASKLESLAANEVRRYVYLRTGKLLPVKRGTTAGDRIVVSCKNESFCGQRGTDLGPQQFTLKTATASGHKVWWVIGGDEVGTLYGAYRFAETLGVRFGLEEDVVPDELMSGAWPEPDETGTPRFALRGLQPFHDFSVGPDWWNLGDYQSVLSQMAKLRLNFIGLHTYPSWNPAAGPEANVWIGLPEDVDNKGNVRFGYEAGVVTTERGWAVKHFPTSRYASGAGLLFESDEYGPDFMLGCLEWPKTAETAAAMFNRYGDFQQKAFSGARRLGIKTCVGTELPLGVPKALAARLEARGMKPDDPATIRRLYEGTYLRLMRKLPLDYFWLWMPEIWLGMAPGCKDWEMTSTENTARDIGLAEAAAASVKPPFSFATCGWRLGTREDALWTDKHTPKTWAASSINTALGRDPVEKAYGEMPARPKWAIGWAEDDDAAGAHCCTCWDLQLWAERMFANSAEASRYGCEGMMAIHWRTAAISPNITALSQAGWNLNSATQPASMDAFWTDWGRGMFGGDAGAEAGRIIQKLDGCHLAINALIRGGARTTDAQIAELFAPLRELETLRPRVRGAGNLERLDYWLNFIRASQLRVRTWIMADRLAARMQELGAAHEPEKQHSLLRNEVLPLRLSLARSYEAMIASFVACAKSPGEVGTVSSIESGSRERIVSSQDGAIAKMLTAPLPPEAALDTAYRGAPKVVVSTKQTLMNTGEPQEVRAFVLSSTPCTGLSLYWRTLGEGRFKKIAATHRARQAYRVTLPPQSRQTLEYYLEAALADGQKARWPATAPSINQTVVAW